MNLNSNFSCLLLESFEKKIEYLIEEQLINEQNENDQNAINETKFQHF